MPDEDFEYDADTNQEVPKVSDFELGACGYMLRSKDYGVLLWMDDDMAKSFCDKVMADKKKSEEQEYQTHLRWLFNILLGSLDVIGLGQYCLDYTGNAKLAMWTDITGTKYQVLSTVLGRLGIRGELGSGQHSDEQYAYAQKLMADLPEWMREHIVFKGDSAAPANAPLSDNAREPEKYADPTKDFGAWR